MNLHLFQSARELDVFGFTADKTGVNLPSALGPWTASASDTLTDGAPVGATERVIAAVARDGFYVARSETLSRDTGVPWLGPVI